MNPHNESDLIDLGTASLKTRGMPFGTDDTQGGRYQGPGLSDE